MAKPKLVAYTLDAGHVIVGVDPAHEDGDYTTTVVLQLIDGVYQVVAESHVVDEAHTADGYGGRLG
jgi:hypothetical protein